MYGAREGRACVSACGSAGSERRCSPYEADWATTMTGQAGKRSLKSRYIVIDALPLRRVAAVRLLKALDRTAVVVAVGAPDELRNEDAADSCRLAILNLGGLSFVDSMVAREIAALREILSGTPLVVVSDHDQPDEVVRAFKAGVQGFLPTSSQPEVAVGALELVLAGGMYFPPSVPALAAETIATRAAPVARRAPPSWTSRERAVAEHLRLGQSNKVIARELGLQESTVKVYIRQVMRKLGAANRTQAALLLAVLDSPAAANGHPFLPGQPVENEIGL